MTNYKKDPVQQKKQQAQLLAAMISLNSMRETVGYKHYSKHVVKAIIAQYGDNALAYIADVLHCVDNKDK